MTSVGLFHRLHLYKATNYTKTADSSMADLYFVAIFQHFEISYKSTRSNYKVVDLLLLALGVLLEKGCYCSSGLM